ncbi:complex I intermediate-associated protein 30 [Diaporthe helianthi]|uniref:Complex I intermediate-associated protein 30 n=1 Tax=Diaporthe helianthi TaxID=158607 RepID=A0A2P5I9J2_DIAHE|nr:complex I intermediate-associated protein 30 [Diaporthe helianthi]
MYYSYHALTALVLHAAGSYGASLALFHPWDVSEWVASDDSIRGGLSRSNLEVIAPGAPGNPSGGEPIARFFGNLDYEALNGSGFASQRTVDDWPGVDLSAFDRFILEVPHTDGKIYMFNIKDTVVPPINGVEQASVSWEHAFQLPARDAASGADDYDRVVVRFDELVPVYRGRVQNDTAPLNLADIKRCNIMIRSLFGQESQAGDFDLRLKSILAADSDLV